MKLKTAHQKQRETINLNKKLGLPKKLFFTQTKVSSYLAMFPNTPDWIVIIMRNAVLPVEKLAILTKKDVGTIRKFYLHSIESVVLGKQKIGKALEVPALIKYLESQHHTNTKKASVKKTVAPSKSVKNKAIKLYDKFEKDIVRNRMNELLQLPESPKTGVMLCLPADFTAEKVQVKIPALSKLDIHGFECAYRKGKECESSLQWKKQQAILKANDELRKRITMHNENINKFVEKASSNAFAHLSLDYCNTYATNEKFVRNAIVKNKVKKGGLILLVFSGSRHGKDTLLTKFPKLLKKVEKSYQPQIIPQLKQSPVSGLYYYKSGEKDNGYNMYVAIIRRIK